MIQGLNIRCNVGPVEVLRSPFIELVSRRRAVVSRATVTIPDPEGAVRAALAQGMIGLGPSWPGGATGGAAPHAIIGQPVAVRWGYRGEAGFWQEWEGTVESIDQPPAASAGADAVTVRAVGLEKALTTTTVTESFYREPADAVARRLLARTGLAVGDVDVPGDVLPWQVFSGVSVARAVKQLSNTLERSFGHDMSRHALWLGASGLTWSAGDEPGAVYSVASAENLLAHTPPQTPEGVGVVLSVPLPGLTHSRLVHIRDARRGVDATVRALDVVHTLRQGGNSTAITYGKDVGWS